MYGMHAADLEPALNSYKRMSLGSSGYPIEEPDLTQVPLLWPITRVL